METATFNKLLLAHKELISHQHELEKIILETKIKSEQKISELKIAKSKLKDAETSLDEIAFSISHKIRKSVANILGIAYQLIEDECLSAEEMKEMTNIIIQSAQSLNTFTEELSKSIHSKKNSL